MLKEFKFGPYIPDSNGEWIQYHPAEVLTGSGTILMISAICTMLVYKKRKILFSSKQMFTNAFKKATNACVAILFLIIMSKIMDGSGQIEVFAKSISYIMGDFYPIVSPTIGVFGALVSSSNMSSNILFSGFQYSYDNINSDYIFMYILYWRYF